MEIYHIIYVILIVIITILMFIALGNAMLLKLVLSQYESKKLEEYDSLFDSITIFLILIILLLISLGYMLKIPIIETLFQLFGTNESLCTYLGI